MKQETQHQQSRKNITLVSMVILFSILLPLGMLCACSNSEDIGSNLSTPPTTQVSLFPVIEGEDYMIASQFFSAELPTNYGSNQSAPFFSDPQESVCFVVNDKETLKSLYQGDKALPEVDFGRYTIVLGVEKVPHLLYQLEKQELITDGSNMQLNLFVKEPADSYYPAQVMDLYFWGLYPKIPQANVVVKTVKM